MGSVQSSVDEYMYIDKFIARSLRLIHCVHPYNRLPALWKYSDDKFSCIYDIIHLCSANHILRMIGILYCVANRLPCLMVEIRLI